MTRITLELIRKRSEHNEGEISTLEEIALHQENIEKIELIDKTCRHLKILLLQNNLVSRIENLSRLKELEYLNLALNNIEAIENLEGLESLKKLDLTVNFIGDLRGIKRLRCNERLEQLFLMGNPCADYDGYREYAIAALSQLKELDGVPIERSERIKALQVYARLEGEIAESYARYEKARRAEILGYHERIASLPELKEKEEEEDDDDERFWKRASRHTPEERVAIAERLSRKEELKNRERNREEPRISNEAKLFSPDGKPYNTNQPKVSFKLNDEQYEDRVVLEVAVYKYLDTCHLDVDVQPDYVRVTIKGKVLQLTLPCEVSVDDSTAKRNTTNGTLVVTMPRLKPVPIIGNIRKKNEEHSRTLEPRRPTTTTMREYLEIGPASDDLDFSRIFIKSKKPIVDRRREEEHEEKLFEDSSEVPPLE
uniref:protein tilB homolog isoform X1 n=1 Tax=Osmia lignaria TaxID=473952 RepID=UPI001478A7FE|nr:protein tilB homolog isoform X1 [Osmia lignaria]